MDNSLSTMNPEVAKEWHPSKNGSLKPSDVTHNTPRKIWWVCTLGHEWETQVRLRTEQGGKCVYCYNFKILKGFNDLATTHPELAKEWHPTKNEKTTHEVGHGTPKKYWWLASCGHEWESPLRNRANLGNGCTICCNQKVLVGFNDLTTTHPELAKEWHQDLNKKSASEFTAGSNKKAWWQCKNNPEHVWLYFIYRRSGKMQAACPSCHKIKHSHHSEHTMYFLKNDTLKFYKVGITNSNSTRIKTLELRGWELIYSVEDSNRYKISMLEKSVLKWIRKDKKIEESLKIWEMRGTQGFSETFPMVLPKKEIIKLINKKWAELKTTSLETYAS